MAYFEKRTTRKGVTRWRVQIRREAGGATKTFSTKARAREWALQVEAGITGELRSPGKHTLAEALRRYSTEVSPTKRGKRWEQVRLKALERDPIAKLPIAQITSDQLGAFRDRRLLVVAPASVRRDFNLLAAVWEAARLEWKWTRTNPVRDVRKPVEPPARRRGVKPTELQALRDAAETAAEHEVIDGFELAIETGMRAGEMWGLEPDQVTDSVAHLEQTKNGDRRDVALSPRAAEIVSALLADGRPALFLISNAVRDVLFRRLRNKAKLPDLHFHDSRSEAVTRLSKVLPILELADQIGHRDLKSLQSYYKPSAADRATRLAGGTARTTPSPLQPPTAAGRRQRG